MHEFVARDVDDFFQPGGGLAAVVGESVGWSPGDHRGRLMLHAVSRREVGEEVEEMVLRNRQPAEYRHLGLRELPMGLKEGGIVIVAPPPYVDVEWVAAHFVLAVPQVVGRGGDPRAVHELLRAPGGQVDAVIGIGHEREGPSPPSSPCGTSGRWMSTGTSGRSGW